MKYLVTGGAGFIGTNLCRRLIKDGHSVLCLDDFSTGRMHNIDDLENSDSFELLNHDLTKPFFPEDIDGIFNLACPASPVHYQYNPIRTLKMGTLAMYNVLGIAARLKIPILQASTSEVYGDPEIHPQTEEYWGNVNPIGPRACYDEGKRVAEALCVAYRDNSNVKVKIARIFNTYGPYMDPDDGRVISNFIVQYLRGESLTVYGDGNQTRSFCFVDDLVEGLILLMNSEYGNPVNLGNPNEFTMLELVDVISKTVGNKIPIKFMQLPTDDPKKRRPDITKAKEILGWEPKINLEDGIKKSLVWFEKMVLE